MTAMTCDNRNPPSSHLKESAQPLRGPPTAGGGAFSPSSSPHCPRFVSASQTSPPLRRRPDSMQCNTMRCDAIQCNAKDCVARPPAPPNPELTLIRTRASMMEVKECRSSPSAMAGGWLGVVHPPQPLPAPGSIAAASRAVSGVGVVGRGVEGGGRACAARMLAEAGSAPAPPLAPLPPKPGGRIAGEEPVHWKANKGPGRGGSLPRGGCRGKPLVSFSPPPPSLPLSAGVRRASVPIQAGSSTCLSPWICAFKMQISGLDGASGEEGTHEHVQSAFPSPSAAVGSLFVGNKRQMQLQGTPA